MALDLPRFSKPDEDFEKTHFADFGPTWRFLARYGLGRKAKPPRTLTSLRHTQPRTREFAPLFIPLKMPTVGFRSSEARGCNVKPPCSLTSLGHQQNGRSLRSAQNVSLSHKGFFRHFAKFGIRADFFQKRARKFLTAAEASSWEVWSCCRQRRGPAWARRS